MKIKIIDTGSGGVTKGISSGSHTYIPTYQVMWQGIEQDPMTKSKIIAENLECDSPELSKYIFTVKGSDEEIPLEKLEEVLETNSTLLAHLRDPFA